MIEATLYDRFGFRSTPPADVTTRFRRFANETQHEVIGTRGLSRLRRKVVPFTSTTNSPYAVLPQAAVNVYTITDRVNNWVLDSVSMEDIRARNPGLLYTTSYPQGYAIMDYAAPVALDPSDASELFVKSDSASDGATKKLMLEGIITGGYYQTASAVLNGVTAVSLSAAITNWVTVTKMFIAPVSGSTVLLAAGNVTLCEDSGAGTELSRIPPGRSMARYTRIHFDMPPSAVNTYYADIDVHIEEMSTVADEPYLPEEFHSIITCGASMKEFKRRKDWVGYGIEKSEYIDILNRLKLFVRRRGGVSTKRTPRERFSQLGPWFSPGS